MKLPDGTSWPDLEQATEAAWRARFLDSQVSTEDRMTLASVVSAYWHLVAHPAGTEAAVKKLRMLRRRAAARG